MCWAPYNLATLPAYCTAGFRVWSTRAPLINFHIVEYHHGDRVLRQFGMRQTVPCVCDTDRALHTVTRRGNVHENWARRHRRHIQMWDARHQNVPTAESADPVLSYYDPYMVWFRSITRIRVGRLAQPVPSSGYQPVAYIRDALADQLARVSALSQDAMGHGDSSQYQPTLQQVHNESLFTLEHVGRSYLIPPPGSTVPNDTYYMDPLGHSTVRQGPNVCAEASSSRGPTLPTYSEYGTQGGASIARGIYDNFFSSSYSCQETAHGGPDFDALQPDFTRADEYHTQGVYEDPTQGVYEDPTQGQQYEQTETQGAFECMNHPRRPRTRGGRVHRDGTQPSITNVPIPEDGEYVPHNDPSHVRTRVSRFGRPIRPRGCGI